MFSEWICQYLVIDLRFEEKLIFASDVATLLQEFSAGSHIPV